MGGAYVQIIGAETLKSGSPVYMGWIPALLIGLVRLLGSRPQQDRQIRANLILAVAACR